MIKYLNESRGQPVDHISRKPHQQKLSFRVSHPSERPHEGTVNTRSNGCLVLLFPQIDLGYPEPD